MPRLWTYKHLKSNCLGPIPHSSQWQSETVYCPQLQHRYRRHPKGADINSTATWCVCQSSIQVQTSWAVVSLDVIWLFWTNSSSHPEAAVITSRHTVGENGLGLNRPWHYYQIVQEVLYQQWFRWHGRWCIVGWTVWQIWHWLRHIRRQHV